jgi:AcrR family transcriptional regulator
MALRPAKRTQPPAERRPRRVIGLDRIERSYYFGGVGALRAASAKDPRLARSTVKGDRTRETILTHALALATRIGLEGLTIGRLAEDLHMSKSGLFAHFRSKEALQLAALRMASARMVEEVVRPALVVPRGEARVRALFERWLAWEQSPTLPGGCPFLAASFELDDRPGPVRDFVVQTLRDWSDMLAGAARIAVQEGDFRPDLDVEQFAYGCQGIGLAFVHASRLLRDPIARRRADLAFEALVRAARRPSASGKPVRRRP